MNKSPLEVQTFYNGRVAKRLKDFLDGNQRIERGWLTIDQWAPSDPKRILEIGSGIGFICWRMARRWPKAEVVGLDISADSAAIARKLFGSSRLSFVEGVLEKGRLADRFDLIIMMDVYEHIAVDERPKLHEGLDDVRNWGGRIILTFPTPRHQAWLRKHHPDQIQPIDEDVNVETVLALARDTRTELFLYQEVGVWHEADYAHAVLGEMASWVAIVKEPRPQQGIHRLISKPLLGRVEPLVPPRSQRLALIRERLGPDYCPD